MSSRQLDEEAIFDIARRLEDEDAKSRYLDQVCSGDQQLRDRVEALLQGHQQDQGFLNSDVAPTEAAAPITESPGQQIGRYKLREQIGEGGMGIVFVAEQERPIQRKVALKIIKPGMDTKEVIARFEAERQALALMNHPNIAKVLDAGTTESGHPYFVMELVQGIPITAYCDRCKLTTNQRLELFVTVCQAVQHAHQKGVIHRDLKPSNVMITEHDGKPVVKVIDFGVAKAINQRLTEQTIYTRFQQMIGTPMYMSPEQAELSGLDVDTRSDVYSLGVLLYEVLTGTTPFDKQRFSEAAYDEIRRIIRDEEPPKPSTKISTMGASASDISERRNTDFRRLSQSLRGELDWIVMKALEKDRGRRYETANGFAADIQRYLDDEPVRACPPSAGYQFRKFARRNKAAVVIAAATIAALMLTVGMLVSFGYQRRLESTNERLAAAKDRAEEALTSETILRTQLAHSKEDLERVLYFRHVSQALSAWYDNQVQRTRRLLDKCPPKWRHWEWHYVNSLFLRGVMTLEGHQGWVTDLSYSPDGKRIMSFSQDVMVGGRDQLVIVWDADSGQQLFSIKDAAAEDRACLPKFSPDGEHILIANQLGEIALYGAESGANVNSFKGHDGRVWSIAFSADGNRIASGGDDHLVKVWDAKNGQELFALKGHKMAVSKVAFSPDGKWIASRGDDEEVKIWDAISGENSHTIQSNTQVRLVGFSRDSNRLTTILGNQDAEATVHIWDVKEGRELLQISWPRAGGGRALSPDGGRIVVGGKPTQVLDLVSGSRVCTFEDSDIAHDARLLSSAFSPNGRRVVTGGFGKSVKIWDAQTGRKLHTFKGHTGVVTKVAFSPDGKRVASASRDATVKIWDAQANQDTQTLEGHTDWVNSVAFSPDGKRIASGSSDNTVKIWDATSGDELLEMPHSGPVGGVRFTPNGRHLVSHTGGRHLYDQGGDHTIKIWDAERPLVRNVFDIPGDIRGIAISPSGTAIAVSGWVDTGPSDDSEGRIWVVDAETGQGLFTLKGHTNSVKCVAFAPNGKLIASAQSFGGKAAALVKIWDAKSHRELCTFEGHTHSIQSIAFGPDGKRVISGAWDDTVKIWNVESGLERTLNADAWVTCVAVSPDGSRIAAANFLGTVKLWHLESGEEALTLHGHTGRVWSVAFSPDGRRIVSGGADHTIKIWDAGTSEFMSARP